MTWPGVGYHLEACGAAGRSLDLGDFVCERWKGHPGNHVGWLDDGSYHAWSADMRCQNCHERIYTNDHLKRHWVHIATNDYDCHLGAKP